MYILTLHLAFIANLPARWRVCYEQTALRYPSRFHPQVLVQHHLREFGIDILNYERIYKRISVSYLINKPQHTLV